LEPLLEPPPILERGTTATLELLEPLEPGTTATGAIGAEIWKNDSHWNDSHTVLAATMMVETIDKHSNDSPNTVATTGDDRQPLKTSHWSPHCRRATGATGCVYVVE